MQLCLSLYYNVLKMKEEIVRIARRLRLLSCLLEVVFALFSLLFGG